MRRCTIHRADVLTADFAAMLERAASLDVVGNLPYYITSEILLRLFAAARAGVVARAVLMMQREVAERIAAAPGASEYGALSAATQMHAQVTNLFTLPPSAFSPPPEVYSTVLRLEFAPRFAELGVGFEGFNQLAARRLCAEAQDAGQQPAHGGLQRPAGRHGVAGGAGRAGASGGRAAGDDGRDLQTVGGRIGRRRRRSVLKQTRGLAADAVDHAVVVHDGLEHGRDVLHLDGAAFPGFGDERVDCGIEAEAVKAVQVFEALAGLHGLRDGLEGIECGGERGVVGVLEDALRGLAVRVDGQRHPADAGDALAVRLAASWIDRGAGVVQGEERGRVDGDGLTGPLGGAGVRSELDVAAAPWSSSETMYAGACESARGSSWKEMPLGTPICAPAAGRAAASAMARSIFIAGSWASVWAWWMWQMAMASASAASAGWGARRGSNRRATMNPTCSLAARP